MKLTVELKLLTTPEQAGSLRRAMAVFNEAATHAASVGFETKSFHQVSLHHKVYYELRSRFGLPAQMAVKAISKAIAVFNRDRRKCPVFRPEGSVGLDKHLVSFKMTEGTLSVTGLDGRIKGVAFTCGDRQKAQLTAGRMCESRLVTRKGVFYVQVAVELPEPAADTSGHLGVDLGIVNLATASDGTVFSGEHVKEVRKWYQDRRSALQSVGTPSARRRLRKLSGRERLFQRDVNHVVSKRLVERAKALNVGIALEDLRGIRRKERTVTKPVRSALSRWAFAQLRTFVTYKAVLAGVAVQIVKPAYTSVTCSSCGHLDKASRKTRDHFECTSCGFAAPADLNAAVNIGLSVNQPMVG